MMALRLQAKFVAYRQFAAGSFRPTAGFITPSAAYGLLLNLAGIDMRADDGKSVATTIRPGLPRLTLALGAVSLPERGSMFQQLHNYPIGKNTAPEVVQLCWPRKHNVTPVRRELLIGLDAVIAVKDTPADLPFNIRQGLEHGRPGYGLPFCGDNNLLPDRIEEINPAAMPQAQWLTPILGEESDGPRDFATRLTVTIHRLDMTQTRSLLMGPSLRSSTIPAEAWVPVVYP